jgi:hypothetical protein
MRDDNRKMRHELAEERRKVEKLVGLVGKLWDVVGKTFPGSSKCDYLSCLIFFGRGYTRL